MRRRLLLTFLLCTASAASARAGDEGEDVLVPLPWHADDATFFLRRIVDGSTGSPVAGATVRLFSEVPHPEPGFGVPSATAISGPDGWVRIRKDQLDPVRTALYGEPAWAYVEAPGLGPDAVFRRFLVDEDWPLRPAAELRVTLHDPLDRPVRGARVGWLLGCGHTPDVRQAVTDEHGVARLVGVQDDGHGQIWFVKEGFVSRYLTDDAWRPGTPERIARVEWGMTVQGTVLHHDGTPAKGVAVGRSDCHRGPWTRTDATGRFRLVGLDTEPGDDILVEPDEDAVGPGGGGGSAIELVVPLPGHDAVVRLPAPGAEAAGEEAKVRLVVELTWQDLAPAQPLSPRVVAVRLSDGWTTDDTANDDSLALMWVRPGTYVLYAHFAPFSTGAGVAEPIRGPTVVVRADVAGEYAAMALPTPELLTVRFDTASDDVDALLLVEGGTEGLLADAEGTVLHVPVWPTRPAFLRVQHGPRVRITPIEMSQIVEVDEAEPLRVRARFLDADGKPVRGWLLDEDLTEGFHHLSPRATFTGPASETPVLETLAGARVRLVAWPEDLLRFQPVRLPLRDLARAPKESDAAQPVDLGDVRVPARRPSILLECPEGRPLSDLQVIVTRGTRQDTFADDAGTAGEILDPWYEPGLLAAGAVVRITDWMEPTPTRAPDVGAVVTLPFVRRLEGPGPWHLRHPTGVLDLEVRAGAGEDLSRFELRLDGTPLPVGTSSDEVRGLRLVGLEAGPHELVIETKAHRPRRLTFTLADGETRRLAVRLTPAAPPR